MFVDPDKSYAMTVDIWNGKPTGRLVWYTIPWHIGHAAKQAGYADPLDFLTKDLGALAFENIVYPFEVREPQVEVKDTTEGDATIREYRSPWGTLREVRRSGEIIGHRVKTEQDLRTLIEMWKSREVRVRPEVFDKYVRGLAGRGPVQVATGTSSLQTMLQHDLGVENFWYLIADYPELVEEAMDAWQSKLQIVYDALGRFDALGFYQGENTSTTAISPDYYRRYSIKHIRQFTAAAAKAGKRSLVHMCGHLRGLMPMFPETGMNGIDCLTPPPVGNCPFEYAYEVMPKGFFCTGRFNSNFWVGKSRTEILAGLAVLVPHRVYREHAFAMVATTDMAPDVSADNLRLLRDCINEYESV
jgi:hypothetical protein